MKILIVVATLFLNSCSVSFHRTESDGVRVNDSRVFKYNKNKYKKFRGRLLDTACIYLKVKEYHNNWTPDTGYNRKTQFVRFFAGGQVLFTACDSIPNEELINNPNVGVPGYYIIEGTKIKVDRFELTNGGQTGKYFGRVLENGDLIFYEERPETYFNSFFLLEKAVGKLKYSLWKKIKYSNRDNHTLTW
ncbi:MAG TPA: hypothetical protein VFV37_04180 [Luteibaculaceae bacterium]|nr:hypothetical protein [Luteibaculaceae bacterium]